ncbi:MAG: tetratricopeptide repeat protein [Sulfuricella sp.]
MATSHPPTPAFDSALQQAIAHHQAGRLQEAEQLYAAILKAQPDQPDANHNLGILLQQTGQHAAGLSCLKAALDASPSRELFWLSYADGLLATGQAKKARNIIQAALKRGFDTPALQSLRQKARTAEPGNHSKAKEPPPGKIKKAKTPPPDKINRLVAFFNAGRYVELESQARLLLEQYPDSGFGWKALGASLKAQGKDSLPALQKATELEPGNAEAHNNLGVALKSLGQLDGAAASYRRALEIKPDYAEAHYNLGITLQELGQLDGAVACYRRVLEIKPDYIEALSNLALTLKDLGQLEGAVTCLRRALEIKPDYAWLHSNLGSALKDLGHLDGAVASYRRALEINPDYAEAHSNLGSALKEFGQFEAAAASLRRALEIKPDLAEAHNNLGGALTHLGQLDEAVASCRRALEIRPDYAEAYSNLSVALKDLGQLDDAVACLRRALEIKPDYAEAYSNLGVTLQALNQPDSAIESYQRALEIKPDYADAHYNLGFTYLILGKLKAGWEKYEWRWKVTRGMRPFPHPWWDGSDLTGKTILVWGEQGVGDEILFASVLPDVIQATGHCVVECDPRLVTLFARSFPQAEIVPRTNPPHPRLSQPDIQLQCPMGNLPRWFRPTLESFPQHHDYLKADPERAAYWKQRLDALGSAPKVGVAWRSRLRNASRDIHYTELSQWGPILSVPGAVFVNLQYDECRAELEAAQAQFGVAIHAWDDIDLMNDLDDAIALTACLDFVITAPTAVSAMSGGVGVPTWCMAANNAWDMLGADDYPWTPNLRFVFRTGDQSWENVLNEVATELTKATRKSV